MQQDAMKAAHKAMYSFCVTSGWTHINKLLGGGKKIHKNQLDNTTFNCNSNLLKLCSVKNATHLLFNFFQYV